MKDKEFLIRIGQKIVEIRTSKGIKQIDLAHRMEIEDSSLRRIEKGRVNSTIVMLRRIAKALNVDIKDIIDF